VVELLIRIREVFGSNCSGETDCPDWSFSLFSSVPPKNAVVLAQSRVGRFLQNTDHFIISLSSIHSTLLKASLWNLESYSELCVPSCVVLFSMLPSELYSDLYLYHKRSKLVQIHCLMREGRQHSTNWNPDRTSAKQESCIWRISGRLLRFICFNHENCQFEDCLCRYCIRIHRLESYRNRWRPQENPRFQGLNVVTDKVVQFFESLLET
jgi:hypothetical protein